MNSKRSVKSKKTESSKQSIKKTATLRSMRVSKMESAAKNKSKTARTKRIAFSRKLPLKSIENFIYTRGRVIQHTKKMIKMELSKQLIKDKLEDIYKLSELEQGEYVGAISFNVNDISVKYNSPLKHTNRNPMSVRPPPGTLDKYIVYHTHPIPKKVGMTTSLVSLPSLDDFVTFIKNYPKLQANIILERNGFYVIDIIESKLTTKPDPAEAYNVFRLLLENKKINDFLVVYSPRPEQALYGVSIKTWKALIDKYINSVMLHRFNMSIKYYTYDDTPIITLLNPQTIPEA